MAGQSQLYTQGRCRRAHFDTRTEKCRPALVPGPAWDSQMPPADLPPEQCRLAATSFVLQAGGTPTMSKIATAKLVPHLWYATEAEEAARFYASLFPDSSVDRVTTLPVDTPSGPAGS